MSKFFLILNLILNDPFDPTPPFPLMLTEGSRHHRHISGKSPENTKVRDRVGQWSLALQSRNKENAPESSARRDRDVRLLQGNYHRKENNPEGRRRLLFSLLQCRYCATAAERGQGVGLGITNLHPNGIVPRRQGRALIEVPTPLAQN